ncbi:alpha-amylase family glycosyl hydrolase [[Eubacterium] cellulosolvens]
MKTTSHNIILSNLESLYGKHSANATFSRLDRILNSFSNKYLSSSRGEYFSNEDNILITYGDMIKNNIRPLKALDIFTNKYLKDKFNTIHILPFFEYDSDRGFSIINFKKIDLNQGNWSDIADLKKRFKLMFDLILNHVSDKHIWFQEFLQNNPKYENYFIWFTKDNFPSKKEIKKVFRPRTNPLFKRYNTSEGEKYVWTTFPLNQVDLNYKNKEVLIEIIDVMLHYILKGADIIRLDAVAYIWKQLGTNCLHLKPVHIIVQLLRAILDEVAPNVLIITETNVPHEENIQYFGDGRNEAQLVYNFALPPLVLFSLYTGNSKKISKWAEKITLTSKHTAFLNFLDSHDGIGLLGVKSILTENEIAIVLERCSDNGGLVSYKKNIDGTETPYEINITWWNALNPSSSNDNLEIQISRYLVSRAIPLCLKGVPGTYFNGLIGALNDLEGLKLTGKNRDINRKNLKLNEIEELIADRDSRLSKVFYGYNKLIQNRIREKAFHPNSLQEILFLNNHVFALKRSKDHNSSIIALQNLTKDEQSVVLKNNSYYDIITHSNYDNKISMTPYQVLWLKHK